MDGSRGYYANWNKSDRERQIPYDLTYMWNLKKQINKENRNKLTDKREQIDFTRWEEGWWDEWKQLKGLQSINY